MLDKNALHQLRQLKQDIRESVDRGDGLVRGSQGRFGFVRLDDGRDIFLAPDEMQKVFPGDRIRIVVNTGDDGKASGIVEKLLESPLSSFTGRYVIRGKGHFVEPDLPRFNRRIFLPPSQRKGAREGDLLACRIARHPVRDGKGQADLLRVIGSPSQPGIEADYCIAKFELRDRYQDAELAGLVEDRYAAQREDLSELPFLTIDAAESRDLDDALYAEVIPGGWKLLVAVADPSAFIAPGSALEQAAAARATTAYLPGRVLPMLPESITFERCSLLAGETRPALVCEMQLSDSGEIVEHRLIQATIRSQHKLSYSEVNSFLNGGDAVAAQWLTPLRDIAEQLLAYRRRHHLVMQDRADFRLLLNEQGKIESIRKIEKSQAHRLVEECMLAANRSTAQWLAQQKCLFVCHRGIREDRLELVRELLRAEQPALADTDFSSLPGYIALMQALAEADSALPLYGIVSRMLERGQFSLHSAPHFGLGFERYTTFTSPLRKFNDLIVHRHLHALLADAPAPATDEATLAQLQETQGRARQASYQLEQWLKCQYMADKTEQTFNAKIVQVSGGGFTVRLDENGIEGFVDVRSIEGKLRFDHPYLRLSNDKRCYQLEQDVQVKVAEINEANRQIVFALVEGV